MARARNNIARLSAETRLVICELLDDGVSYDDIRAEAAVAAELAEKDIAIHNSSFRAYRGSDEFDEYRRRRREWDRDMRRRKLAAAFVRSGEGPESLVELVNYNLLQRCMEKLDSGEELEPKELNAMARAVNSFQRHRDDARRIENERRIAELEARIVELTGGERNGITPETIDKILEAAKLL